MFSFLYNLDVWLLKLTHLLLVVSLIGLFSGSIFSRIPFVKIYGTSIKQISILFLVVSIFFEGYFFASKKWMEKVKEFQDKVVVAEQQSKDVNIKLDEKSKELTKQIRDNKNNLQNEIKNQQQKIDAECKVAKEAVKILNDAASGVKK